MSTFTRTRSHLAKKEGALLKRARRDEDSAQLLCFGWTSQRGCGYGRKGNLCKVRHDPDVEFRGEKQRGGGASGAADKKVKTGAGTAPIASASGAGEGAVRVETLSNCPRLTTNRGAGSVGWRSQLRRPSELSGFFG